MINLLPLRLIFIRTYERDSDRERLREDVLLQFRALKCCGFLWTVFLRAFSLERGTGKSGSEKRRKMEGKSGNRTERKERRNSVRKSEREKRNDSVLTDEEKDSIASRMKRRKNQQPNDNVDENNSYEY